MDKSQEFFDSELNDASNTRTESKHSRRRRRKEKYYRMLDSEIVHERHFVGRIVCTMNRDGLDWAPDGRPIKSDWWGYISAREKNARNTSLACLDLMERTIRSIRPSAHLN